MKMLTLSVIAASLLLLAMPAMIHAQEEQAKSAPPPIGQNLVREGELALRLHAALGMGTAEDEAEAESRLGEAGVAPRNGWIADYPVTPDIVGELQKSVEDAAEAGKLSVDKEDARRKLDAVIAELSLRVKPHVDGETREAKPSDAEKYPNPTVIEKYYYEEGPPVVTYYAPPPDYYYLYAWVPYPFWWYGFWFPGFFVLHDFHKTVIVNRRVVFVSNHFNDVRSHRVFRVDPVRRFRGRTFAGIGVHDRRGFISTGVPRSERRIFNGRRERQVPAVRSISPQRGGRVGVPQRDGGRVIRSPSGGSRMGVPPAGGGRVGTPRSGGREMRR